MAKDKTAPSKVEVAKKESGYLRGTIDETLRDPSADHFEEADLQLLKFHGTYQQDNRDERAERRKEKLGKAYSFMIRIALPGGVVTPQQYLDLETIAEKYTYGSIRITTRQAVQYHGVIKGNLRDTMREINEALMTTLAACGDVCRNVMASAPPFTNEVYTQIRETTREVAVHMAPKTGAYHQIWIDGELQKPDNDVEPFYGENYLPRKYKVGVTVMGDNQIDVYSYDAGLVGIVEDEKLIGYNVVAGGGLGMSHGRANTYAQIAWQVGFVSVVDAVKAVEIVASIYRDFGNRNDRKQARLKYLIGERGIDWFREEFSKRAEFELHPFRETPMVDNEDWLGLHRQDDDHMFYGVFVENGRIQDNEVVKYKSAFHQVVSELKVGVTFTAQQSLLFTGLKEDQVPRLEEILKAHSVPLVQEISNARRYSMACPAMPTCGLAVAESERALPDLMTDIEGTFKSLGIDDAKLTIRMTGCPNGCARPYTADLAFVGRRPGIYHIFVGGRLEGDRMADLYAADVKIEESIETLTPLLTRYAADRKTNEGLGDFYQRLLNRTETRTRVTGKEEATFDQIAPLVQLS